MSASESTPGGYPADAFKGTARYYSEYRRAYPEVLVGDLISRSRLSRDSRVLDLACGTGRLGLSLAGCVREVIGVDSEAEMLAEGSRVAGIRGFTSMRWMEGSAESMEFRPGSFSLITIADAFHRLDRAVVASLCVRWLEKEGYLALIGSNGPHTGDLPWQRALLQVLDEWTQPAAPSRLLTTDSNTEVLTKAGFRSIETFTFPVSVLWSIEEVVGFLRSTSFASDRALGTKSIPFENRVREVLLPFCEPSLAPVPTDCGYTLGRAP